MFVYFSEEKIDSLLKETLRPASTLLTHVQICIVFWILGKSKNTTCHFVTGFSLFLIFYECCAL